MVTDAVLSKSTGYVSDNMKMQIKGLPSKLVCMLGNGVIVHRKCKSGQVLCIIILRLLNVKELHGLFPCSAKRVKRP